MRYAFGTAYRREEKKVQDRKTEKSEERNVKPVTSTPPFFYRDNFLISPFFLVSHPTFHSNRCAVTYTIISPLWNSCLQHPLVENIMKDKNFPWNSSDMIKHQKSRYTC